MATDDDISKPRRSRRNQQQTLADWHQLVATHEEQGLHIDRHTAAARLHGDGYDHGVAIASLLRRHPPALVDSRH